MSLTNTAAAASYVLGASEGGAGGAVSTFNVSTTIGFNVAPYSTGSSNTFIGYETAVNVRSGNYNTVLGMHAGLDMGGDGNVYIGLLAGAHAIAAGSNTVLGTLAGSVIRSGQRNTTLGFNADVSSTSSSECTVVGANAVAGVSYATAVGSRARATGTDSVALGARTTCAGNGAFNINNRVSGTWKLGTTLDTYLVQVDADALSLAGAALSWCPALGIARGSSNLGVPTWTAQLQGADLVFQSKNGAVVTMTDDFQPGVLNFTGQHRCAWLRQPDDPPDVDLPGCVVVATGAHADLWGRDDPTSVDERVPVVMLARKGNDRRVFGAVSKAAPACCPAPPFCIGPLRFAFHHTGPHLCDDRLIINAAGEGALWVCDLNGAVRTGDLVVSSPIPGMAMRQRSVARAGAMVGEEHEDEATDEDEEEAGGGLPLLSTTLAKLTGGCDFRALEARTHVDPVTSRLIVYRRARVPCVFVP